MSLKKLGLALIAIFALGAVVADNALATATESNGFWYVEGKKLEVGEPLICKQVGEATLTTTVGTEKTPLKLNATGATCPETVLFNESSKAKGTGLINLSGVTVVEPAGCSVAGGTVKTKLLSTQVYMEGTKVLMRVMPASGTTFAEPEITGCSIAGTYPIKGIVFGESTMPTNFDVTSNVLTFSGEINSAAGGSLTVAGHPATLGIKIEYITTSGEGEKTIDKVMSVKET